MAAGPHGSGMGVAAWLGAGGLLPPGLARLWFGSPLYRLTLSGRAPQTLLMVPPDPWPGDAVRGNAMMAGDFAFAGRSRRIEGDPWQEDDAHPDWLAALHGFTWLRDVREVGGEEAARFAAAMVDGWLARFDGWSPLAWRADVVADRLASWIAHSALIARGAEPGLEGRLLKSLAVQRRHLMRVVPGALQGAELLRALKGLVYTHLALDEREAPLQATLAALSETLPLQVLPDGGHVERSPAVQLDVLRDLVDIRGALQVAHKEVPEAVISAIDRLAPMVRFFRHADGGMALFNDTDEGDPAAIDLLLARSGAAGKPMSQAPHSGFQRLAAAGTLLIVDTGPPPPRGLDRHVHAGTLSFELSAGRDRLIVNCGAYGGGDANWRWAQRTTAAHSTAVIDDTNSSEIRERSVYGHGGVHVLAARSEAEGAVWLEASHDGYVRLFGVEHKRRLYLSAAGDDVRGEDTLADETGRRVKGAGRPYAIRFHLHPGVRASLVQDGGSVLLQLPNGQGWRFRASGASLSLQETVYLGTPGEVRRAEQIVLSGTLQPEGSRVKWALTRFSQPSRGERPASRAQRPPRAGKAERAAPEDQEKT